MPKNVEVLLTKPVLKLGTMGDIVAVRPGYARNYLLPQGFAIPASAAAKRQVEVLKVKARELDVENEARAKAVKADLDGFAVTITAKVAHEDHLFGSVGVRDIVAALKAAKGYDLDPKQVNLSENIKTLGRYAVTVELFGDVHAQISVVVANENPEGPGLDETLAEAATGDEQAEG